MLYRLWLVCITLLLYTGFSWGITVSGHAELRGENEHANILVLLLNESQPDQSDSVLSNTAGDFVISISVGTYRVRFTYTGFGSYWLPPQEFTEDVALDPVTLLPSLSGVLSGVIETGEYQIDDSAFVPYMGWIEIRPGTIIRFTGNGQLTVEGHIYSEGNETDSVYFTRRYDHPDSTWKGFTCEGPGASIWIYLSVFEYATAGIGGDDVNGGGIRSHRSAPHFFNCAIRYNQAPSGSGGGIAIWDSLGSWYHARLENCVIAHNEALFGGGAFVDGDSASAQFVNCNIHHNTAQNGGGVAIGEDQEWNYAWIELSRCLIAWNEATETGGGVAAVQGAMNLQQCTVIHNTAAGHGSAASVTEEVGGLYLNSCIIASNTPVDAVSAAAGWSVQVNNSCIFDNPGGNFFGLDDGSLLGIVDRVNLNADSTDRYSNLYLNPLLDETDHLQWGSPCIDAADSALDDDPDGTVPDIGAFFYDQLDAVDLPLVHPSSFILSAYPNPFNASTTIRFELPHAAEVQLEVFNLTGQRVALLANGFYSSGLHAVHFDATDLPSGVYLYRLRAGQANVIRKLVLIK